MNSGHIPKIKPWVNLTGFGRDDIAVKLAQFFAGEGDDPLMLVYSSAFDKGFLAALARPVGVGWDRWARGTIDEAAAAAHEWLEGLTDDRRMDFYCGYPTKGSKICLDHGFRLMTDTSPVFARIIPALV